MINKNQWRIEGGKQLPIARPFFRKFKIRPSLLSPNRAKMPFKFHLYGLFMH